MGQCRPYDQVKLDKCNCTGDRLVLTPTTPHTGGYLSPPPGYYLTSSGGRGVRIGESEDVEKGQMRMYGSDQVREYQAVGIGD